jgi:formyltetrahydrofolate deformylase
MGGARSRARPRVGVLASKQGHCLGDLLLRGALGELPGTIALVASNHDDHAQLVGRFDLPFTSCPSSTTTANAQERTLGKLLDEHDLDVVVLARYMRILPRGSSNSGRDG